MRGLLPEVLAEKVPQPQDAGRWPVREHARKVLLLAGCVQPAMMPRINYATARVLDAAGIQTVIAPNAGCCGAVKFHLNDQEGGKAQMRANIDAWWPQVDSGAVEAIVMNASGCGVTVKEYGHLLKDDAQYADKAARISALTRDLSELLPELLPELAERLQGRVRAPAAPMAYHPPCTLQHGQSCAAAWKPIWPGWASSCAWRAPSRTCAAARREPTRCCSPNSRTSCATARSAH